MVNHLLEARALRVNAPGTNIAVLDNVDFALEPGTCHAIVGESGSGKTTLLRALLGLADIAGGAVLRDGRVIADAERRLRVEDRRGLAMLFQDPIASLSPRRSVGQAISDTLRVSAGLRRTAASETARSLLSDVGLPTTIFNLHPHTLSGGQARRVALARALAQSPAAILADEPTAGLDVSVQGDVLTLLSRAIRRDGLSLLLVTHNLAVVRHMADSVTVLYLGRVTEQGPAEAVLQRPRHPYTRILLAAEPRLSVPIDPARIQMLPESTGVLNRSDGCAFAMRCPIALPQCASTPPPIRTDGNRTIFCHSDR